MKAQQFQEWMHRTGCRSAADVVRLLDIGRNTALAMVAEAEAGQVLLKHTVALAMTAVVNGLRPWDDYESKTHDEETSLDLDRPVCRDPCADRDQLRGSLNNGWGRSPPPPHSVN